MELCFLCNTAMEPRFRTRDHLRPNNQTEYQVEWCGSCSFGKVAGEYSAQEVAKFYTENYYTHALPVDLKQSGGRFIDRLRLHLAYRTDRGAHLSPTEVERRKPSPTLCDLGCGSGGDMAAFKAAGFDAVGIEPDPAARAVASQFGEVFAGTAESLPAEMAGKQFDVVLLSHVLEHCIDPERTLSNVKRILAPDGHAIIEIPNNAALGFAMYGPVWFFSDVPRHLQFFTRNSLRKALDLAGLKIVKTMYAGYTRQFSVGWLGAQKEIRHRTGLSGNWRGNVAQLLTTTAFAPASCKYDSLRVHATHK